MQWRTELPRCLVQLLQMTLDCGSPGRCRTYQPPLRSLREQLSQDIPGQGQGARCEACFQHRVAQIALQLSRTCVTGN